MANAPLDMNHGDFVKAVLDSVLHFMSCLHSWGLMVVGFCCTPILLDEIELTVVFWIEVTDVAL